MTMWLLISVPLVLWDAGCILLGPHSMAHDKLHSPVWTPYVLYGTIDYSYGWPAFNARNGFTIAQTVMNLVETAGYIFYLYTVYVYGVSATDSGRGSKKGVEGLRWLLKSDKVVSGREGAIALLVGYSVSVMTVSKTTLYWLNEIFAGFQNIRHTEISSLILLWAVPNCLFLLFPSYNIYILGAEILKSSETAIMQ